MTHNEIAMAIVEKTMTMADAKAKENLSADDVKAINALVKTIKKDAKDKAFHAENNVLTYKGIEMPFNPTYCADENVLIFSTIDANSYVYISRLADGKAKINIIPRLKKSNKAFEWKKALSCANIKKCIALFGMMFDSLSFDEFLAKCKGYKGYKEVKCPSAIKDAIHPKKATKKATKKAK